MPHFISGFVRKRKLIKWLPDLATHHFRLATPLASFLYEYEFRPRLYRPHSTSAASVG